LQGRADEGQPILVALAEYGRGRLLWHRYGSGLAFSSKVDLIAG